jgi:biotin transport system substrate-specific component
MHTANPASTSTRPTLSELSQTLPGKIVLAVSASAFVALCAHASIRLPFTPVPITLSDLAVLMVGLALGPSLAFAALVLYLAEGAMGMPVFNPGPGGLAQLLGPTGGYLFAYPLAAAVTGMISQKLSALKMRFFPALLGATAGSALIITCGVLWLTLFVHYSLSSAFFLGAMPFLPGQVAKVLAAAGIVSSFNRLRRA